MAVFILGLPGRIAPKHPDSDAINVLCRLLPGQQKEFFRREDTLSGAVSELLLDLGCGSDEALDLGVLVQFGITLNGSRGHPTKARHYSVGVGTVAGQIRRQRMAQPVDRERCETRVVHDATVTRFAKYTPELILYSVPDQRTSDMVGGLNGSTQHSAQTYIFIENKS